MSSDRRRFLKEMAALAAALSAGREARAATGEAASAERGGVQPTVIATWDYGLSLCTAAQRALLAGKPLLDALEAGVCVVEDDPNVMSVGYGGLPNEEGVVQLDAAIMDGRTHRAGAVAAIERIKNPIRVARQVMERTNHVLLVGAGANAFAKKLGFVEEELLTPASRAAWHKAKTSFWKRPPEHHDTVCGIGIDRDGNMATAVSTSGLAWKLSGRVGDSPILGAGSYVDNEVGAACATGVGELTMRTLASFAIVERMRAGADPTAACTALLHQIVKIAPEVRTNANLQLAFIAMNRRGEVGAAVFRRQEKVFRYAIARGTSAPKLIDVPPLFAR